MNRNSRESSVLSPILSNTDRSFMYNINNFIQEELRIIETIANIDQISILKEKYQVLKQAFGKIIIQVQAYKTLLSNIKREYEYCINELEKKRVENEEVDNEISKLSCVNLTVENLEHRKYELTSRLNEIKSENERLKEHLNKLVLTNEKFRKKNVDPFLFLPQKQQATLTTATTVTNDKNTTGLIPGLSLEKSTNVKYLSDLLKEVETKLNELTNTQSKKYSTKQQKHELENVLFEKISVRDNVKMEGINIRNKIMLYKLAMNITKDYYKENTKYSSIQEALSKGLLETYLNKQTKLEDEDHHIDDSGLENESEQILDYIDKFNDLFEIEKYEEAAYFAAASPKNVLRNIETLFRFKNVSNGKKYTEKTDPLLIYCNSIIDSINDSSSKPNSDMSLECIKVALKYNKLDLLTRWIAQRWLSFSHDAARTIEEYARLKPKNSKSLHELALFIYTDIKSNLEAAICMAKLGRLSAMVDFIKKDANLAKNNEIYFKILQEYPDIDLANTIIDASNVDNLKLPIDKIVSILLDSDQPENGLKFLKIQIEKNSQFPENEENLRKLKTSYETLMKFSFLAQDEDQFTKEVALESRDHLQNIYMLTKVSTLSHKTIGSDSINARSMHKRNKDLYAMRKSPPDSIPEDKEEDEAIDKNMFINLHTAKNISKTSQRSKFTELTLLEENEDNYGDEDDDDDDDDVCDKNGENCTNNDEESDDQEASPFD